MVNIKSKNLLVLLIEIDENDPQKIIAQLEEKLNQRFFSNNRDIPFLIQAKEGVNKEVVEKVVEYLTQRGFSYLLKPVQREDKTTSEVPFNFENLKGNNVLVVNRNLRSGQIIEHAGDVVILGSVNPGAEVRATGNVIVLGELKGIAWAGYLGNKDAVIVALKMQPQQLRIANLFAPVEDTIADENKAQMAKVVYDEKTNTYEIEIEPLA
jgi:septum site-determining protein MinC